MRQVEAFTGRLRTLLSALDTASLSAPVQHPMVPYLLPICVLLEMGREEEIGNIDLVLGHLNNARVMTAQCHVYRSNCITFLNAHNSTPLDPTLLDMLSLHTQQKLLWGARGLHANRAQRVMKLEQVLDALSAQIEPPESSL